MILTAAEKQLIKIIRAAHRHVLSLTVRTRDGRYPVRIITYDSGVIRESFETASHDVIELRAQAALG